MPFQVSPGVNISEIDLTTVAPAVSSTEAAIAGVFNWGPVDQRVLIESESALLERFGKPNADVKEAWFTASSFLAYGNKLYVVRAANTTVNTSVSAFNAIVTTANVAAMSDRSTFVAKNTDDFDSKDAAGDYANNAAVYYMAKWPGDLGTGLEVSQCDSAAGYASTIDLTAPTGNTTLDGYVANTSSMSIEVGSTTVRVAFANAAGANVADLSSVITNVQTNLVVGDKIVVGNNTIGTDKLSIASVGAGTSNTTHAYFDITTTSSYKLSTDYSSSNLSRRWKYADLVDRAPGISSYQASNVDNPTTVDEIHVVIADKKGKFTGVPGTVLEVFEGLSRASNATTADGATNYYRDVINAASRYAWALNPRSGAATGRAGVLTASTTTTAMISEFVDGSDGPNESSIAMADLLRGYDLFASAEDVDISLVLQGKARGGTYGEQLANYIIDNICEVRRDCVAFISPAFEDVVRNEGFEADAVVEYRNAVRSTSYAVMDSGYKYTYDKYNDVYRNIPLNGDIAGLAVYTDATRDPWWSPAGFSRGQIKNVVRLAYNPSKAERDILYKAGVNPVTTFPGQGTILFGDKTLLSTPSAFDRINVRRLFIVLEKAIAKAAQSTLFEFNDEFTRAQFKNLVEPFLRDVQGRRGIYAYKVVVDETNNTSEVIDRNEFIGDIYIKPAKSINFIQLNFVAVRTGVEFSEIVGNF